MKIIYKIRNLTGYHPIIFALWPILALWSFNSDHMSPIETIEPLILSLIVTLVIFFIFRLVLKNRQQANLLTSLIVLLFFTYGHVFGLLKPVTIMGETLGRHRYLAIIWLVILLCAGYLIIRYGKKAIGLNKFLDWLGLALLILTAGQFIYLRLQQSPTELQKNIAALENKKEFDVNRVSNFNNLPDIYLIVLDSYAREDMLMKGFNYDNQPFLNALKDLGFVLPRCTMSNYQTTPFSMSSELNMNYLEAFDNYVHTDTTKIPYSELQEFTRHSLVRKNLEELGYKIISFESMYSWVEIPDADIYYAQNSSRHVLDSLLGASDFDQVLTDTSVLRLFSDAATQSADVRKTSSSLNAWVKNLVTNAGDAVQKQNREKYDTIMFQLQGMENLASVPGPKFVYVHVPSPHKPSVLLPDGEYTQHITENSYVDSITYLNQRMLIILRNIISQSKTPPIIILQGDHGLNQKGLILSDNLNAYYLPGNGKELVYSSITPVNTFRIIFNAYFNGNYAILKDASYAPGANRHFYDFQPVRPNCPK